MSIADERSEEARNLDVLVPGKSAVEHHVKSIRNLLNLQTSTCDDLNAEHQS